MISPFGLLIIEKPRGITSHDVVAKIRRHTKWRVGHGGTLDPLATGVLPLLLNGATKISSYLTDREKSYEFTMKLGEATATGDAEGEIIKRSYTPPLTHQDVVRNIAVFKGAQEQIPPMFSAVKIKGSPLYRHARRGETLARAPRQIVIFALELLHMELPALSFRVSCSKGTYIRQLAVDIAAALGTVAHVTRLHRTKAGPFDVRDALPLEEALALTPEALAQHLVSPLCALTALPQVLVSPIEAQHLLHGKGIQQGVTDLPVGKRVLFTDTEEHLIAIGEQRPAHLHPLKVFPTQVERYLEATHNNNQLNEEYHHGNVNKP